MEKEKLLSIFPERLREAVTMSGISYRELADKLGVNKSTVSMYLHGKALPSLEIIVSVAEITDVSLDFLTGRKELYKNPPAECSAGGFCTLKFLR